MATLVVIIIALIALGLGLLAGFFFHKQSERRRADSLDSQVRQALELAHQEADGLKRRAELEAKEMLFKSKSDAEQETRAKLNELQQKQERLLKREENLERKGDQLTNKENEISKKEQELTRREKAAEISARQSGELLAKANKKLEELAAMTKDQARDLLIQQITDEAKQQAASVVKKIEEETEQEAKQRSVNIIASAIQRYASEYTTERTVAVVPLPNDEMKGRIIGREGRNIRALEAATGVDLIVDDTPEAVILSCFHPVRREVARLSLTRLIADGRIHPSRIEEIVKRCEEEVEASCKEAGEQAVFDLGLHRVHPELIKLLGQLKFRASYAQNLLQHSVEVGYMAGIMASELGLPVKLARRAGLLHDIGKAASHEMEGPHALVGAEMARKYGESPKVAQAIACHHGDEQATAILDFLVEAANRLSGQRPGARRERLHTYVHRLQQLESMCKKETGVERVYAIQAGREVRVIVDHQNITDEQTIMLSKDIVKKVEEELTYPGQVKVCVVRETRASAVAR